MAGNDIVLKANIFGLCGGMCRGLARNKKMAEAGCVQFGAGGGGARRYAQTESAASVEKHAYRPEGIKWRYARSIASAVEPKLFLEA